MRALVSIFASTLAQTWNWHGEIGLRERRIDASPEGGLFAKIAP